MHMLNKLAIHILYIRNMYNFYLSIKSEFLKNARTREVVSSQELLQRTWVQFLVPTGQLTAMRDTSPRVSDTLFQPPYRTQMYTQANTHRHKIKGRKIMIKKPETSPLLLWLLLPYPLPPFSPFPAPPTPLSPTPYRPRALMKLAWDLLCSPELASNSQPSHSSLIIIYHTGIYHRT